MSKAIRMWAVKQRLKYGLGFSMFWVFIGVFVYFANFYVAPSCFDGIQNNNEAGIDCGGSCVAICADDVLEPRLQWVKSFEIDEGQYNAVAYVENPNQLEATPSLKYTFTLYDGEDELVSRSGETVLPPNSVHPVFEGRLLVDPERTVTRTEITFTSVEDWYPASFARDQFRTTDLKFVNADTNPSLDVEIENTSLRGAQQVEVVATVFDAEGEPVTASQTLIENIEPRSTESIVFTWPTSIAKTVRTCEISTDVAVTIDLSGSMNNDGGNPPQPITDALAAANQFVRTLREGDQAALVTFATNAAVDARLSWDLSAVGRSITSLQIQPEEERGYTNTPAALQAARNELNSVRHNKNARRVVVILTDGLPTAEGDEDVAGAAENIAERLAREDIEVYAIGLGQAVNRNFILSLASDTTNAYLAPTVEDLAAIYAEITSSLCESGPPRIDIIAKGEVNFAPPQ